ncbi:MAG: hypothetical protein ILO68_00690 [Clostridia bacterium]|nr:hypothetical protein [Clostridia bacterium]
MIPVLKRTAVRLWQWTWGFPQNAAGFLVFAFVRIRHRLRGDKSPAPSADFRHAVVTGWNLRSALSLGMFLFVPSLDPFQPCALWVHEFGHSVQSCILGPLFLPVAGFPSMIWAGCFRRFRKRTGISYYRFLPEKWANRLGASRTGMIPPENVR